MGARTQARTAATALLLLTLLAGGARGAGAAGADLLAYNRHGDIVVMAPDGSGRTRLTRGPAWDHMPTWSPDGTKIAFVRCCSSIWRRGASALMVMNADGTGQREISRDLRGQVYELSWSPDSAFLLYADVLPTGDGGYRASLRITDAAGEGFTRLTGYRHLNVGGLWSPDGSTVLFMSDRDGDTDLYLMNPDGTDRRRLTRGAGTDFGASWSPDGRQVAFVRMSEEFGFSQHLSVVDVATGAERAVTSGNVVDNPPVWHPDGTSLAFVRLVFEPEFDSSLWTVTPGETPVRLGPADARPAWSPAGDRLTYDLGGDVHLADPGSGAAQRLTDEQLWETGAAWRPVPPAVPVDVGVAR